jgi:hypothetical protein
MEKGTLQVVEAMKSKKKKKSMEKKRCCKWLKLETIWGRDCLEFKPERWISEFGARKNSACTIFQVRNI